MRIGHHAEALDAKGRLLPDKIWGWEMPVLADFPSMLYIDGEFVRDDSTDGLDQAREWAAKVFAADSRVAAVSIRQSIQEYDGCSWKAGRHVETVSR
jgi:hypothetical protein